ncbi:hypothetical protein RJ53_07035 [Methanocalculus chunghsingensis]|uniref:DUF2281 domain-containing protein n=1 Tax=Methanocalculus chunghsingensis TaxID=156457 RepID=A0A8J7WAS6_9EURY|nr:DUF2281 domain-containing protein [Methanocalculus chunghsingensis]MBR1369262.1 hypothetical protein [Methanocalculus chunghsingensis]
MTEIEEMIQELSPDNKKEVKDFIAFLLRKQKAGDGKPLRLSWAGALSRYRDTYTALELQEQSLSWRSE